MSQQSKKQERQKSIKVNALLNVLQKCCSIVIPLIVFPYVAKRLGPISYGKYSFSNSVISYFLLIAMLGVNTYAIREGSRIRNDREKLEQFFAEVFSINLITMLLSMVILILITRMSKVLHLYQALIMIQSIQIVCTVLGRDYINTIFEDFLYLTVRYVIIQLIGVVCIFGLVKNPDDYMVYTLIMTLSASIGYILNLAYTRKYARIKITRHLNLSTHLTPILILFCAQIATAIYIQSDITMLGFMCTEEEVGIYTLASKIYVIAKSVINAITAVTIPRIVYSINHDEKEKCNTLVSQLIEYILLIVVPSMVGMVIYSRHIMIVIGDMSYVSGSLSLKILGISLGIAVFSGLLCNGILVPHRKEKQFLKITIISALVNIGLNCILIPTVGMDGAAVTTLISELIVLAMAIHACKDLIRVKIDRKNLGSIVVGSGVIAGICIILVNVVANDLISLVLGIVLSVIGYVVILVLFRNHIVIEILQGLQNKIRK